MANKEDNENEQKSGGEEPAAPAPRGRGESSEKPKKSSNMLDLGDLDTEKDITKFHDERSRATKKKLSTSPRTTFLIHLTPKEDPKSYETVTINGYVMAIPKGKLVSVPLPVARILAEQYRVEIEAGKEMRVDAPGRSPGLAKALTEGE